MNAVVLNTPEQIANFRARVICSAAKIYLKTGMQANRAYTPSAMRDAIAGITGKSYARSRKGLEQAYADLSTLLETPQS